jgi:hypothetical protein
LEQKEEKLRQLDTENKNVYNISAKSKDYL